MGWPWVVLAVEIDEEGQFAGATHFPDSGKYFLFDMLLICFLMVGAAAQVEMSVRRGWSPQFTTRSVLALLSAAATFLVIHQSRGFGGFDALLYDLVNLGTAVLLLLAWLGWFQLIAALAR